jgi:hypothetical protein
MPTDTEWKVKIRKSKAEKAKLELPHGLSIAVASKGKTLLIKHFNGETMPASAAIQAKCCECNGYWIDGRQDCKMPSCPLYPWQPYKNKHEVLVVSDEEKG